MLAGKKWKQAALAAGFTNSMAENTAQKIVAKPAVFAELQRRLQQFSAATLVDAARLHADWSAMHQADIADIINSRTNALKPVHQWPPIWRRMIRWLDVRELFEHSKDGKDSSWDKIGELVKIRFIEITKIGELLGRLKQVDAFVAQKVEGKMELEVTLKRVTEQLQKGRERLAKAK